MTVFQSIQDNDLVQRIAHASTRMVFVAPGVSDAVAKALVRCMQSGQLTQVMIVLDADEETCRLGYCDAPSLNTLFAAAESGGFPIRRQAGLRIGLLMADDDVLIWTPTPLMFEAPRTTAEHNGIVLTPQTFKALPEALGVDPQKPEQTAEIGTSLLKKEEVAAVVEALKAVPLASFDISRLARVFSAKFQFIETVLRGAELTRREMRLDSLIVNSDAPEALRSLLHTTIQPFSTDADKAVEVPILVNGELAYRKNSQEPLTKPTTQAEIRAYWTALTDAYIFNLPGFGKIIFHEDKVKFEQEKAAFEQVLKAWVEGFRELVKSNHSQRVDGIVKLILNRMKLADDRQKLTSEVITALVEKGLATLRIIEPGVKVVYKNITVESARDEEFKAVLGQAVPKEKLQNWYEIFSAAPMVNGGSSPNHK